jgi:osmotically-inducible protein OsmY
MTQHTKDSAGGPPSEERSADALLGLLDEELQLRERGVRVTLENETFRLEGEVPTRAARERAEEIARSFADVERVDNRLKVEVREAEEVEPASGSRR